MNDTPFRSTTMSAQPPAIVRTTASRSWLTVAMSSSPWGRMTA
jgi:hypothetical protein